MQILEDGSLLMAAVRAADAGKYTCIRTNEAGSVEESAFLSVLGEPCSRQQPKKETVPERVSPERR